MTTIWLNNGNYCKQNCKENESKSEESLQSEPSKLWTVTGVNVSHAAGSEASDKLVIILIKLVSTNFVTAIHE